MGKIILKAETSLTKTGDSIYLLLNRTIKDFFSVGNLTDEEISKQYTAKYEISINKKGQTYVAFWIEKR